MSSPSSSAVEPLSAGRHGGEHRPVDTSELFFDLIFVFAITQLSAIIRDQPGVHGLVRALIVMALIYWTWTVSSVHASLRDMTATYYRLVLFSTSLAALVMAFSVAQAFEDRSLVFVLAYWAARTLILVGMLRHDRRGLGPSVLSVLVICPVVVVGAFVTSPWREVVWAVCAVAEFLTPRLDRRRLRTVRYDAEHIVERFGLLVLLALGESLVAIGEPLVESEGIDAASALVMLASFVLVVGLWWLYFHHTNALLLRLLESTRHQADVVRLALSYTHFGIVGGIIVCAAGLHEAMAEPRQPLPGGALALLLAGPGLLMVAAAVVRWGAFHRPYRSRIAGAVVLALLSPLLAGLPAVTTVAAVAVVVALVATWETVHPRSAGLPAPEHFTALAS